MRQFAGGAGERRAAGGVSRREFGRRAAALLAAGATLPFYNEAALAQDLKGIASIPPDAVRLNANESPVGPCPAAREAARAAADAANRYPFRLTDEFVRAMAESEGLPASHVLPSAGSSDPLHRAVLAFTSPTRPLVVATPGYEAPEGAARFVGAQVVRVPLRKDHSHDPLGMARAQPDAGVIYVCNPNNPTGTVTRKADVEALVANKPHGCVVLLDEAYVHFAETATTAVGLVADGKDVIVLRTFSKIYGMAGLRAGAALGRPDLLEKLRGFGGLNFLPATGLAAAVASLKDAAVVPDRRRAVAEVRTDLFGWLEKKGYGFIRSEANMVMIDVRRPGAAVAAALLERKVAVGRTWPSLPTHVRVTIGTREEMAVFRAALERVMDG
jgi:histidinol-phosphate aminotransferase